MYDVIIIGAGVSGLAAGIRLAYYNKRVCILERHSTIGGLNSFYRLGGRNYDVGLHALTNFTPKGARKGPLSRILRQLRFAWDEFELCEQLGSRIAFSGATLSFNNDSSRLVAEVERLFPGERDRFQALLGRLLDYDDLQPEHGQQSAREIVGSILHDQLLIEMLFCPLMFYGNARERDMDWGQFCIMFRSIFLEGLSRPYAGVRLLLKKLVRRFKELGGELRLHTGVRQIQSSGEHVTAVVLDDGSELQGSQILSSAGTVETLRLCGVESERRPPAGQLSFLETISVLDRQPAEIGLNDTITFFNDSDTFHWEKPATLGDIRSGVICSPNNFNYAQPLAEGMVRITAMANYDLWKALPEDEYRRQKEHWAAKMLESAVQFVPDFRPYIVDSDMFTPTTIHRFTWHDNGAVYGAPDKRFDGRTHLKNLFLCGTDQGLLGIMGAMVSGISMANQHLLKSD